MVVPSNTWETATMTPAMDTTPTKALDEQRREQVARSARPRWHPQRRPWRRRRFVGRAILFGLAALVVAACGGADPDAASSAAPTVPVLDVMVAGDVATLVANVVDPDGELDLVTIEWGDGTSDTVTSGFPGVRLDHTYTDDGDYTIVLEARTASGQSVTATTEASITAFAAAEAAAAATDDDAGGSGSGTGGSNSSGGSGGGNPPPAPSPSPEPEPSPEPAPEEPSPAPDPVTVDLLDDDITYRFRLSPPDGAGGSSEGVQQGPHGFGIRSYAWHGWNGAGTAEGRLRRSVDATSVLEDMPDNVTAVSAEVSYTLDTRAEVKGPNGRTSTFVVWLLDLGVGPYTKLVELTVKNDDANPIQRPDPETHTGTLTTTLTRDEPEAAFRVEAWCHSTSGSLALTLLNEGYCDALEGGGIKLRALSVTFIPIIED